MSDILLELAASRDSGTPRGIYSVCSAHPLVIQAAVQQAIGDRSPLLIEATSNQVNQFGGYTGMQPTDFAGFVSAMAAASGLERGKLILGGDHLGPNPWQHLPAAEAMINAEEMVTAYAGAGFAKIHLDASMACADDSTPLDEHVIAERAAKLCAAAEAGSEGRKICYVIGTEVPIPGGATESLREVAVTKPDSMRRTLEIHRAAFTASGLKDAWARVIAIVVQPGVEFNHDSVVDYDPRNAVALRDALRAERGLVYEAHSTDYQRPAAYRDLVRDGFAILKVGPALTFALREALFAMAAMEIELIESGRRSNLRGVLEKTMLEDPGHWRKHYHGNAREQYFLRQYSYSDRIRYYWTDPVVRRAVDKLRGNLDAASIPETMLSQYLPEQYAAVRAGEIAATTEDLLLHKIRKALEPYAAACNPQGHGASEKQ